MQTEILRSGATLVYTKKDTNGNPLLVLSKTSEAIPPKIDPYIQLDLYKDMFRKEFVSEGPRAYAMQKMGNIPK